MDSKIFLLLGGNKLNQGILNKFKKAGYLVYVVDWNSNPQLTGDKHYQLDVKDADSIIHALQEDNVFDCVKFAYSSIDLAVSSVAQINRAIGLHTISDEGLKYSSSKSMMTQRWNEQKLLNRISKKYCDFDNSIIEFNQKLVSTLYFIHQNRVGHFYSMHCTHRNPGPANNKFNHN